MPTATGPALIMGGDMGGDMGERGETEVEEGARGDVGEGAEVEVPAAEDCTGNKPIS